MRPNLTAQNRVICDLAAETGFRIGDLVTLRRGQLHSPLVLVEAKTGKVRGWPVSDDLLREAQYWAGRSHWSYVFPSRTHPSSGHRSRQAVTKNLRKAARAAGYHDLVISPHSLRKMWAVRVYRETGSIEEVSASLNHTNTLTTLLYCFADRLSDEARRGPIAKARAVAGPQNE